MEPEEIAKLRTTYVFSPAGGETWGLTYEGLVAKLRDRSPEEYVRVDDGLGGPVTGSSMHFGIALGDERLDGMALMSPEGLSVRDCAVGSAAVFARWLRAEVVPEGLAIMFNTSWGLEDGLPDALVPDAPPARIANAFAEHLVAAGDL
ncbi:hypothetical protein SZN_20017 [Streptomyces zinciresistens K42]|uniref:Uncharacterized protein n=1 Tax=Streptomyces zinciresistens K42 TaxID=700597 RepID=G2GES0_9ACTN|nr:hypothetical protein [Streptomyces zinciresistens]EGX57981.1 hypothetical protein SZN_20017 [Streptomyces zinciresistens K42]